MSIQDERVLADAQSRHGRSPFIVRTAFGKWHAYYRFNGERRRIKPDPNVPIDILGAGFVVAPPSRGGGGYYEIVQGSLDDLHNLPILRGLPSQPDQPAQRNEPVYEGRRNDELLRACREHATQCHDEHQLAEFAMIWNRENCVPPDDPAIVMKTVASVWKFVQSGRALKAREQRIEALFLRSPDATALLHLLIARYRPGVQFELTNTYAATIKWDRKRFARARAVLIEDGHIDQLRAAYKGVPAVYRMPLRPGRHS